MQGWRSAIRTLNPGVADATEATCGTAMSLGLRAALAGESEWTPDLETELSIRRPGLHAERRDAAVDAAVQLIASRNPAAAQQARLHYGIE